MLDPFVNKPIHSEPIVFRSAAAASQSDGRGEWGRSADRREPVIANFDVTPRALCRGVFVSGIALLAGRCRPLRRPAWLVGVVSRQPALPFPPPSRPAGSGVALLS